jgi:hypothetical protein
MADFLSSWGAVVHGEEETVVQLLKRVRKPSSTAAPWVLFSSLEAMVGAYLASLFPAET